MESLCKVTFLLVFAVGDRTLYPQTPRRGHGTLSAVFPFLSEVPRTPLTLRNPLVEVAFVGGFVCSAALASVAVLGLLLCAQSPLLSAGMVSPRGIFFSLTRVPQIPFGVT